MRARRLLAGTVFIALSFSVAVSQAGGEAIQLVIVEPQTVLLRESAVRLDAELSSLGFEVRRCGPDDQSPACNQAAAVGRLELESGAGNIRFRAFALHSEGPLEQTIALTGEDISAEVVAIRAVELLRGALLGSLRSRQVLPDSHTALARFTGEESSEPPDALLTPAPSQPEAETSSASQSTTVPLMWSIHLGSLIYMAGQAGAPSVGFALASELNVRWLYLGLSAEWAPFGGQVSQVAGVTDVHVISGFARLGWNAPCGADFDCKFGFGVGFQQLQFRPQASEGYVSMNAHHESLAIAGESQLLWHWSSRWGVFGLLRVGGLAHAPVLVDSDSGALGRPFGSLALGVSFRVE